MLLSTLSAKIDLNALEINCLGSTAYLGSVYILLEESPNGGLHRNLLQPGTVVNRDTRLTLSRVSAHLLSVLVFFSVLRTWSFILLYAFIPSGTSCCVQIFNRKSSKMVRTGTVSRDAGTYDTKCVMEQHGKLRGLLHMYLITQKGFWKYS